MRRLRVALALLVLALAVPVALLVARALESAAVEERVRHEAVASRVFDEMERTLSDFLEREEARTPDDYRFYRWQSDDPRSQRVLRERSPLSRPAAEPFVVAHFQIEPDGSLRTPLIPRDEATARRAGDWPPGDDERATVDRAMALLERTVAPFWRDAERRRRTLAEERSRAAESGPAIASAAQPKKSRRAGPAAEAEPHLAKSAPPQTPAAEDEGQSASALGLIESLNVGAQKRADRKTQIVRAPPAPATEAESDEQIDAVAEVEEADDPYLSLDAPAEVLGEALARLTPSDSDGPSMREALPEAKDERRAEREVRIVLEPMAGVPIGADHLMLHRTVLVGGEGFRQGLLIDRAALGEWLAAQVIGTGTLARVARVSFAPDPSFDSTASAAGAHLARHRFAEPFGGLAAALRVGPLQASNGTTTVLLLAGALAVVAVLGVWAVYRMTSVVVEFAERRSNFVAAVSHELKTPLTAIRMHGEMLRDGLVPSDDRRDDYYRTITDESERLSRLIDNVLEFSRLEKGQRALTVSVGSPAEVVADIVERLRPHAEREGFSLECGIAEPTPSARFDRDALSQMIFNLVDNAIKYGAESARKHIVVRCGAADDGGVSISVRDHGPGVPREQLERIFEPFHRVQAELTRTTKGSGIGLSLVKQLAEAMGAAVVGECPDDGGFRVRIHFARVAA